ncbi:MAG: ATP-binding cassette domain-containing protein [Xanthomonadales bacterium]|nr:ATP-binding cassette domain-containing protein [Xanthomonadales bacterium]
MLSLNQVSLRRGPKLLFENASFQVHAGQRLGVIGANGSGKTSLFSLLLGSLDADSGEVRVDSVERTAQVAQESPVGHLSALDFVMDGDEELRDIQAEIRKREAEQKTADLPVLYERLENIDGFAAEARAARLLHGLGFPHERIDDPVNSFSGGWKMRLNLAQALMCRSDLLLLDEPTNHLDLPAILWLEQWLKGYEGILLVISHDRDFLDSICTRMAHIERQKIRLYNGNYSQFERLRGEQLAQQQIMYERQQKDIKHIQSYVDRFRYKASKARQAQSRIKMLERMAQIAPAHADSPFRFHFMALDKQPQHMLKIENGVAGYGQPVLTGIDLQISAGDRLGLLGVNGAGKSTLVKALADGSTLMEGDREISKDTRIGYFAQHQLDLLQPALSPIEHLRERAPGDGESQLRDYLGRFGFGGERVFDPVVPFSGGEKARLVLALMIRQQPNLLLLDEPTNHLDLEMRHALSLALAEYSGALVVISHDRHLLRSVCDELLIVHDGTIDMFDGSIDEYPAWLREQQSRPTENPTDSRRPDARQASKKELRQREARRREQLKPLLDEVRGVERQLTEGRAELERLEQALSDESLYSDPGRTAELTNLVRDQGRLRASLDDLEWRWLEASEAVEKNEK